MRSTNEVDCILGKPWWLFFVAVWSERFACFTVCRGQLLLRQSNRQGDTEACDHLAVHCAGTHRPNQGVERLTTQSIVQDDMACTTGSHVSPIDELQLNAHLIQLDSRLNSMPI